MIYQPKPKLATWNKYSRNIR